MIDLEKIKKDFLKKEEIYLRIKVRPNAGKNKVMEIMEDDTIKIAIKAVPEKGKANKELIKFLTKEFKTKDVKIISGAGDKLKLVKLG